MANETGAWGAVRSCARRLAVSSRFGQVLRRALSQALHRGLRPAVQRTGRMVHRLLRVLVALAFIVVLAGGAFAWRLAQGPLEIGWLTRRVQAEANAAGGPPTLVIGSAALAWEGFTHGVDSPLDIQLTGVALLDAAGARIAEVPRAEVSLSAGWLVLGRVVPRAVELDGVRVRARRSEDGRVSIDLGHDAGNATEPPSRDAAAAAVSGDAAAAAEGSNATTAAVNGDAAAAAASGEGLVAALLHQLAQPAETDRSTEAARFAQIRQVRVRDAELSVDDRQLGATWRASDVGLDLVRLDQGGAEATADLTLALGIQRLHVTLQAALPAGGGSTEVQAHLTPIVPARLAGLAPGLAALQALDAPVAVSATATVGADLVPAQVKVQVRVGAGYLRIAAGSVPLIGALAEAEGSLTAAELRIQRVELVPQPDHARTVLRGKVVATRTGGRLNASISGELDRVDFADLAALWPAGVGGPGTRPWITENITEGLAHDGRFDLQLTARDDLSDPTVTSLSGGIDGQDLTVHWLRPVPPIEHVNGRLSFVSPDEAEITATSGRQTGGGPVGLTLQSGRVRLTGLSVKHQFLTIEADLAGPAADLLTVLKHPRLHLLDRRPLEIHDPSGAVTGRLTVTRLPLENNLTVDDVHIQATGKLTRLHLGGIAGGHDIDQGTLEFDASNTGLKMRGTALLAGIASQVQGELDFRDGGPAQVLQKVNVTGTATGRQLATAGFDSGGMLEGPVALQATWLTRRDDRGEVLVRGDLGRAVLQVPRLNFRKPAGQPASAELHLTLEQDRITGFDRLRLDGDGIALAGRVLFAGGSAQTIQFDRIRIGDATDASGEVRIPHQPGAPWDATLNGRSIDASAEFGRGDSAPKPAPEPQDDRPGTPWRVDAHFDRVVLGAEGRELMAVAGTAESDGRVIRQGKLTGRTGAGAGFRLEITPGRSTRTLTGTAEDAGGLLRALDLIDAMRGGRLSIRGTYDDRVPGHPLQGTAEIADFRMQNAPALAKLLQVMTLYGLVEALEGSGLGFNRLIAPFQLSRDTLELTDARAFSASLGMTAKGRIDLAHNTIALEGTIVPAYFFNTMLSEIPLIGRLFSPERGGGVFAATYAMSGPLGDPAVSVNPLAALTPGFLRGLFGIFDGLSGSNPTVSPGGGAQN